MQTLRRPTPGHWQATSHSISKTPARQKIGNSPILLAVTHPHGFAPADLRFDLVEKFHARTIGREIALDLGLPLTAISLSKPAQEGYLLLIGKRLNSVLDLPKVHIRIVPLCALTKRITPRSRRHLAARPSRKLDGHPIPCTLEVRFRESELRWSSLPRTALGAAFKECFELWSH